jgi:hypothetical protein
MADIIVVNESTMVSDADLATWTRAVQRQITEQVAPFWGVSATLHNLPKGTPLPAAEMLMVVLDDADTATALGYHDLGPDGQPMGKVFARTTINDGSPDSPSRVLSHEVIELLVDPNLVRFIDLADAQYLVEVGDPVCLPSQGYAIDNVLVSDWATPAYYHFNTDRRFDFRQLLPGPCPAMIHGSYLMFRTNGGAWDHKQMLLGPAGPELDRLRYQTRPAQGSRRYRRLIGRTNWIRSAPKPERQSSPPA